MPHEPKPQKQDKSEPVYFGFVFKHGEAAFDFAKSVIGGEFAVDIGYVPERRRYQVIVRRKMLPLHRDIKVLLADLSERAARFGGERDGWGKSSQ
jgi:Regulator of ribonuclease activity B